MRMVRSEITMVLGGQGQTETVQPDDPDVVGWPTTADGSIAADGELLFVGFGIRAPAFDWDDYGDTPVAGRILVMLPGDPGIGDSTLFRGALGTEYGNTARKLREAASRGARGVIFVHDRNLTGLPWEVARAQWSGEVLLDSVAQAGEGPAFVAWVSGDRLARMLASFQRDWSVLRSRARRAGFRPIPLGMHAVVRIRSSTRSVVATGVLGLLRGTDPALAGETVVVTANYDHLGAAAGFGVDSVFNGARDNAAGVATLMSAARILATDRQRLRRSVLFAALSGAEGSAGEPRALAAQVPVPAERIAAVVNVERPGLSGNAVLSPRDAAETGLLGALEAAGRQEGVAIVPWEGFDPLRETHLHRVFARLGVPAVTVSGGAGLDGAEAAYFLERFHQPDDAFDPTHSFETLAAQARTVARFVRMIANADDAAAWAPSTPYREAWERLQRRRGVRP